ncbi:MAG: DNA polymerase III subunit gamma/tau [Deltaproteobacteria bacterium]|jgi:DNA polymerase-3 subunit gamma/tau|nr:DNA polymerase III subunit gamma/tau [Deltaproteobacteria bacterium]
MVWNLSLQGDFRLTPGFAWHTVPVTPSFSEGTIHPAPIRRDGVGCELKLMHHASLTTRYRPQTFAELAGQNTLKGILSRAAAEGKIAPAYLFSGTRGVGKTTVARIFAKALNCLAPVKTSYGLEPCNACDLCRGITQGSSLDVLEIDGASNRGIDDVRALKESVGYAPMEGRYKIFIIDEAHMLSREAFNALLKTLEEPPAQVTFMLATTEPHKFPLTIVSRCQHYVFKRLSDAELFAHLQKILGRENIRHEDTALRLLVRRAAGSARDAVTLLSQVLALGGTDLKEADTRSVLGLAGQELFFRLLAAIREGDCAALSGLTGQLLDQGIDLGFFLRELTLMWRNLFMLRQIGSAAENLLELPAAEVQKWNGEARNMDLAHIHACWQLTLEGQRRVLTSLEPSLALELLLFNLAMLPRLMPLEQLSNLERLQATGKKSSEPASRVNSAQTPAQVPGPDAEARSRMPGAEAKDLGLTPEIEAEAGALAETDPEKRPLRKEAIRNRLNPPLAPASTGGELEEVPFPEAEERRESIPGNAVSPAEGFPAEGSPAGGSPAGEPAGHEDTRKDISGKPEVNSWQDFLAFCTGRAATSGLRFTPGFSALLYSVKAEWDALELRITPPNAFSAARLARGDTGENLRELLLAFCGKIPALRVLPPPEAPRAYADLKKNIEQLPVVRALEEHLGATLIDYGPCNK